jgi:ABC-type glutathione transport system ATPase component
LIDASGLSAGYGGTTVLHDIDLKLDTGGALGVIGESGSGKTTLARVVAGLLPASAGTVRLDGKLLAVDVAQRSRVELRRELGLALVFISHDLHIVRAVCDEAMILYAGRVMERGPARADAGSDARCVFRARCALRIDGVCDVAVPPLRVLAKGSSIRCHRDEADLRALQSPS